MTNSLWHRAVLVALCASAAMAGCSTLQAPFARLDSAVTDDKFTNAPSGANVRVIRDDVAVAPTLSMPLRKGDSISTSSSTQVVLTFAAGYEVTLDSGTTIHIENPSIFLKWGRAFIRRLTGAPDTLDTKTRHAVLHDVGTAYVVSVTAEATTVRVETGIVDARMRGDSGSPYTRYGPLEGGVIAEGRRPVRMATLSAERMEQELQWVRRVDRVSNTTVPQLDSMTEADARAALARVGLRTMFVTRRSTGRYAAGRVVESTPGAGQRTKPGTFVNLVLEKEPDGPTIQRGAKGCTVPTITGRTEAVARQLLERANLRGEMVRRVGEIDVVVGQQETAGSTAACGSVVHYRMGRLR